MRRPRFANLRCGPRHAKRYSNKTAWHETCSFVSQRLPSAINKSQGDVMSWNGDRRTDGSDFPDLDAVQHICDAASESALRLYEHVSCLVDPHPDLKAELSEFCEFIERVVIVKLTRLLGRSE
jgi:hypothetical protein